MIPGSVLLLQMWLFATVGPKLGAFLLAGSEEACKDRPFEGAGLAMLRYKENKPSQDLFS